MTKLLYGSIPSLKLDWDIYKQRTTVKEDFSRAEFWTMLTSARRSVYLPTYVSEDGSILCDQLPTNLEVGVWGIKIIWAKNVCDFSSAIEMAKHGKLQVSEVSQLLYITDNPSEADNVPDGKTIHIISTAATYGYDGISAYERALILGYATVGGRVLNEDEYIGNINDMNERMEQIEFQEGSLEGSTPGDGSRWGQYKEEEANRNTAYETAEAARDSRYQQTEDRRNEVYEEHEMMRGDSFEDFLNEKDEDFKKAEAKRESAEKERVRAEGERKLTFSTFMQNIGTTFNTWLNQAKETFTRTLGNSEQEANDNGSFWQRFYAVIGKQTDSFPTYNTIWAIFNNLMDRFSETYDEREDDRDIKYNRAEGSKDGSTAGDGARWGEYKKNEDIRDAKYQEKVEEIEETLGEATGVVNEALHTLTSKININLGFFISDGSTIIEDGANHAYGPIYLAKGDKLTIISSVADAYISLYQCSDSKFKVGEQLQPVTGVYGDPMLTWTANRDGWFCWKDNCNLPCNIIIKSVDTIYNNNLKWFNKELENIEDLIKSGAKVINIAEYSFAGALMPSGADVYAHFDGGINFLAHYVSVIDPEGQLGALFCSIHSDGKGFIYTHFGLDIETGMYKFAGSYSSVVGDVPAWITKAFNEDLRDKIGQVEQEVGQVKSNYVKAKDSYEYDDDDVHVRLSSSVNNEGGDIDIYVQKIKGNDDSGCENSEIFVGYEHINLGVDNPAANEDSRIGIYPEEIILETKYATINGKAIATEDQLAGKIDNWIPSDDEDPATEITPNGCGLKVANGRSRMEAKEDDNFSSFNLDSDGVSLSTEFGGDQGYASVYVHKEQAGENVYGEVSINANGNIYLNANKIYKGAYDWSGVELATVDQIPDTSKIESDIADLGQEVGKVEKSAEELKKENAELKEDLAELESVALVDSEMKYGQPRVLYGAGTPQESIVPDNWVGMDKGGCYWNGQPLFVGQVYININATSNGRYTGVRNANYGDIVWKNF